MTPCKPLRLCDTVDDILRRLDGLVVLESDVICLRTDAPVLRRLDGLVVLESDVICFCTEAAVSVVTEPSSHRTSYLAGDCCTCLVTMPSHFLLPKPTNFFKIVFPIKDGGCGFSNTKHRTRLFESNVFVSRKPFGTFIYSLYRWSAFPPNEPLRANVKAFFLNYYIKIIYPKTDSFHPILPPFQTSPTLPPPPQSLHSPTGPPPHSPSNEHPISPYAP